MVTNMEARTAEERRNGYNEGYEAAVKARPAEPSSYHREQALDAALRLRAGINDVEQVISAARSFEGYLKGDSDAAR